MGLTNKIMRLINGRAYRKSVSNTAALLTNLVGAFEKALTSYEVEDKVVDALKANKAAIDAIDWESIKKVADALKNELESSSPILKAFAEAIEANVALMKNEFNSDKEDN